MSSGHNLTLADLEELELDEFDASEYLTSDEAIAAYLTEALECGHTSCGGSHSEKNREC